MAQPSDSFKIAKAYFHALSKVNTESNQYVFESLYKSAHTVRNDDIWAQTVDYAVDATAADAWVTANPTIGNKYTLQPLTEIPGSNGQAWYINDGGTFINSWIAPTDIPEPTTKDPAYGYQANLYRSDDSIVPPATGVWVIDYYAGIVLFQAGNTPADEGWGIPKITCYNYIGTKGGSGGGDGIYGGSGSLTVGPTVVTMGSNDLQFNSTTTTDLLTIDANNDRVGIGIAPTSPLHVDSNDADTSAIATFENTGGDFQIFRVGATPEGSVTANIGDLAVDSINGLLYMKTSGTGTNTGWVAFGTSSLLTVQDEGINVGTTNTLNFIGSDVLAQAGTGKINVYIPTPPFASHFDTTDGDTNAELTNLTTSSRHVPAPTSEGTPFNVGGWTAGSTQACTRTGTLSFSTPEAFRIQLNDGSCTLTVNIYDADGVSVLATHAVSLTANYGPTTTSNITIEISSYTSEYGEYSAIMNQCDIDIATIIPDGGRFSIELDMDNNGTNYIFTQNDLFYDPDDELATIVAPTIAETGGSVVTRHVSGVEYYTTGSDFTADISDIDNLNDSSYPTNQVTVQGSDYGLPTLTLTGSDLTGWTTQWDTSNNTYNKTDWEINAVNLCSIGSALIRARTEDWVSNGWANSLSDDIAINTYTDNTTRVYEDFRLETNRLENDFTTSWDDTQDLTTYDSGNGLQCQCSRLVYPTINFSLYEPNSGSQPDYSTETGDKTYNRNMWHTGTSHSNGLFQLGDYNITETDITNEDCLIEISLDNVNWYIVNRNYTGGALSDGDGCRINPLTQNLTTNNRIEFTLGTGGFTAAGTGGGWGIHIRITFTDTDTTNYIGSFEITNWV